MNLASLRTYKTWGVFRNLLSLSLALCFLLYCCYFFFLFSRMQRLFNAIVHCVDFYIELKKNICHVRCSHKLNNHDQHRNRQTILSLQCTLYSRILKGILKITDTSSTTITLIIVYFSLSLFCLHLFHSSFSLYLHAELCCFFFLVFYCVKWQNEWFKPFATLQVTWIVFVLMCYLLWWIYNDWIL